MNNYAKYISCVWISLLIILPIKSIYIPPYALQGEDVPGHIIWSSLEFKYLKIELPEAMSKKQLYNVRAEMVETLGNTIIVRNAAIEVDGYLGMLFSSRKVENPAVKGRIQFSFMGENDIILSKQDREVYLFRPKLKLGETPREIKVDPAKGFAYDRIEAEKNDEGTLLLKIRSARSSEIQVRTPNSMVEYRRRLVKNLKEEYADVRGKYPHYSNFFDKYISILEKGWRNQEDLKTLKEFVADTHRITLENREFMEKFVMALLNGYWRSQRFLSLPETLLRYIESVKHKKIWLARPENIITVGPKPRILKLEMMPSDLLLDTYDTIKVRDIRIIGTEAGEIEVAKLFEWK